MKTAELFKKSRSKQTSKILLILIAVAFLPACGPSQAELKMMERREMILKKASALYHRDESAVTNGVLGGPAHPSVLNTPTPKQSELEDALGKPDYVEIMRDYDRIREITRLYWWEEDKTSYAFTGEDNRDRRDGLRLIVTADFGNKAINDGYITEPGALYKIRIYSSATTEETIGRGTAEWRWYRRAAATP